MQMHQILNDVEATIMPKPCSKEQINIHFEFEFTRDFVYLDDKHTRRGF